MTKFNEHKIKIPAKIGFLEGQISGENQDAEFSLLVCHPHPQYGGNMANNVVRSVYKKFSHAGYPSLRFNFRGVGSSDGNYSGGHGERQDVRDALSYLLKNCLPKRVFLVGYSFGASIGCSVVDEFEELFAYCAISYPFTFISEYVMDSYSKKPKIFIMGDKDDFTSISAFNEHYKNYEPPKTKKIYGGVNHFWVGKDQELADFIFDWTKSC